ncbi:MAG: polysaccharide deacetylase family protein, partial [Elusimicrobiota bacterium]
MNNYFYMTGLFFTLFIAVNPLSASNMNPGDFFASGKTSEKKIALTFDDGPGPNTEKFLDLLKRENVKATFFVLGQAVNKHDAVMKRIKQDGHEIGSHT